MKRFLRIYKRRFSILFRRIRNLNKTRVVVLGDSHTTIFNYINKHYKIKYYFEVGSVSGATAIGAVNPNSKTNALNVFRKKINRTSKKATIIMQLGEVDCGFVIWFLAQKKQTSIEEQFNKSINNYKNFIVNELINKGFNKIIIMSATLPTLKENVAGIGEIANLRKEVTASQKERTKITLDYNKSLKEFSSHHGEITFLDTDDILLGENGIIKDEFLNNDPLDHHNDAIRYSKIIIEKLKKDNYKIFKC
jgi:hypothetical protein